MAAVHLQGVALLKFRLQKPAANTAADGRKRSDCNLTS